MNTPLQNGLGHIFGPGKTVVTDGLYPVWLDQSGSSIMGGIIDLQYQYTTGAKVVDLYPSAIRTATPCHQLAVGSYVPIPTFRVVGEVSTEASSVVLAGWDGMPKPISGITLVHPESPEKNLKLTGSNLKKGSDGNYTVTISPNAFGALKDGDCLILKEAAAWDVKGLTKSNLEYEGADPASKLNITLVDVGRLLSGTAPVLPKNLKEKLQTVKYEEE